MPSKEKKEKPLEPKINSSTWDKVELARNPTRPHALDFFHGVCQEFIELHGDRRYGEDPALVAGIARFEGRAVMVMGQQKGHTTKENIQRNFGMPRPEGYRKALRLLATAEKFNMPVITFIDTGGAYPGRESEERGVGLAIAENLMALSSVRVPVIALVTGEGGSGGALAIGIADKLLMMENAIYSVASPEAAASILWKDSTQSHAAAEAMKITAQDNFALGIIDEVVPEPAGGAHVDPNATMLIVREVLARNLAHLEEAYVSRGAEGIEAMLQARYQKYRQIGHWSELSTLPETEIAPASKV